MWWFPSGSKKERIPVKLVLVFKSETPAPIERLKGRGRKEKALKEKVNALEEVEPTR